ncbi:MAG: hypothetical protein QGG36_07755, partial [Pirellulaceae bacterium]|nr:hypothetical protein [Pirellulaceae bacterium]
MKTRRAAIPCSRVGLVCGLVCDAVPLVCSGSFTPALCASEGRRRYRRYVEWFVYTSPQRKQGAAAVST